MKGSHHVSLLLCLNYMFSRYKTSRMQNIQREKKEKGEKNTFWQLLCQIFRQSALKHLCRCYFRKPYVTQRLEICQLTAYFETAIIHVDVMDGKYVMCNKSWVRQTFAVVLYGLAADGRQLNPSPTTPADRGRTCELTPRHDLTRKQALGVGGWQCEPLHHCAAPLLNFVYLCAMCN